jgi:hypothetical protein
MNPTAAKPAANRPIAPGLLLIGSVPTEGAYRATSHKPIANAR